MLIIISCLQRYKKLFSLNGALQRSVRAVRPITYKGIYALLMRDGCHDFRTGYTANMQTYFDDKIDIHHIFPKKWCNDQGIPPSRYNSIVNKTPIAATTNRKIGGLAPSIYLLHMQNQAGISPEQMNAILETHVICWSDLRQDDFEAFFDSRQQALLERIGRAMGKPITNNVLSSPESVQIDIDHEDDTEDE